MQVLYEVSPSRSLIIRIRTVPVDEELLAGASSAQNRIKFRGESKSVSALEMKTCRVIESVASLLF